MRAQTEAGHPDPVTHPKIRAMYVAAGAVLLLSVLVAFLRLRPDAGPGSDQHSHYPQASWPPLPRDAMPPGAVDPYTALCSAHYRIWALNPVDPDVPTLLEILAPEEGCGSSDDNAGAQLRRLLLAPTTTPAKSHHDNAHARPGSDAHEKVHKLINSAYLCEAAKLQSRMRSYLWTAAPTTARAASSGGAKGATKRTRHRDDQLARRLEALNTLAVAAHVLDDDVMRSIYLSEMQPELMQISRRGGAGPGAGADGRTTAEQRHGQKRKEKTRGGGGRNVPVGSTDEGGGYGADSGGGITRLEWMRRYCGPRWRTLAIILDDQPQGAVPTSPPSPATRWFGWIDAVLLLLLLLLAGSYYLVRISVLPTALAGFRRHARRQGI